MLVACFHIPDFPAWAFARSGRVRRAVVVHASGRVVAATRAARQAGVEAGATSGRARSLLPDAAHVTRDGALEAAAWEETLAELHRLTPFLADGAALEDGSAPGRAAGRGWAFLRDAPEADLRVLAARLGAQVGLAGHRTTARLAAARAAPGSFVEVRPGRESPFLARFPTAGLGALGFDADLTGRLGLLGYPDLRAARALTLRHLTAQFGREGERLYGLLHPKKEAPVGLFRPPPSITVALDFDAPLSEPADLVPAVERAAETAASQLRRLRCRRVSVRLLVRGDHGRGGSPDPCLLATRVLPEAIGADPDAAEGTVAHRARAARAVRSVSATLLLDLLGEEARRRGCAGGDEPDEGGRLAPEFDGFSVELGALAHAAHEQGGFFASRPTVYPAVRAVHRRFPGAIQRVVIVPHALFDEDGFRFEPYPEEEPKTRRPRRRSVA